MRRSYSKFNELLLYKFGNDIELLPNFTTFICRQKKRSLVYPHIIYP